MNSTRFAVIGMACLLATGSAHATRDCADYGKSLATMVEVDQALRSRWDFSVLPANAKNAAELPIIVRQTMLVDRTNVQRLKILLKKCGWPSKTRHGPEAPGNAWLIAQHADPDADFENQVVRFLKNGMKLGEIGAEQYALYLDRSRVQRKQTQLYGTQVDVDEGCKLRLAKVDDVKQVDIRRKALGLQPLNEYLIELEHQISENGCSNN